MDPLYLAAWSFPLTHLQRASLVYDWGNVSAP